MWRVNRYSKASQALATVGAVLVLLVGAAIYLTRPAPVDQTKLTASTAGISGSVTASGGLRLCNKTANQVGVAIGYKNQSDWITEGWWNVGAAACETILAGPLVARFYYVYAVDYDQGGEWSGRAVMCTRDRAFTIKGITDCVARGFERTGFFEVDTGEQGAWTVQLTEPTQQGIGGR